MVCHLSDNHWMVVDSCIDRASREPIALKYLRSLGVDVSTAIKLVVVTHWHDDHIRGVSQVLDAASQAQFVCSHKYSGPALTKSIATARELGLPDSGLDEFSKVIRILLERRDPGQRQESVGPIWASEGKTLLQVRNGAIQVTALSPSAATEALELHEFGTFIASRAAQPKRRAVALSQNQRSIALWISTGGPAVLLGGDLEQSTNPAVGWEAVVNSRVRPLESARVFKVPHHGSKNADNSRVWTEMLEATPLALIAPYSSGSKPLPADSDIGRICRRTREAYCTAPPKGWKPHRREPSVEKTVREMGVRAFRVVSREMGHIRIRFSPVRPEQPPSIQLAQPALKLCT